MARPRFFVLPLLGLLACDSAPAIPKAPPPPPFPGLSAQPAPAALAPEEPAAAAETKSAPHKLPGTREASMRAAKPASNVQTPAAKAAAAPKPQALPKTPPKAAAVAPSAPTPKPAPAPIVAPAPKAEGKVSVPKTAHLQLDFPAGLQADLNHDPRMQPWINQVVATIDRCYGSESKSNASLAGTIEVLVTMHENERPDADIKQLPPALSPIVACATGGLMRTKMPLFTSKEGTRYTVRLRFSP